MTPSVCSYGQSTARKQSLEMIILGDNLMHIASWSEALYAYDNAIALDRTFATAYMKKATVLAKLGRTKEAQKLYDKAIELNPSSEYIYDDRAKLKMLAMDYEGAMSDIDESIGLNPKNDHTRNLKVDGLIAMKAYQQAITEIDTLIAAEYKVTDGLERKALVQMMMDSTTACKETINALLAMKDSSAMA